MCESPKERKILLTQEMNKGHCVLDIVRKEVGKCHKMRMEKQAGPDYTGPCKMGQILKIQHLGDQVKNF